MKESSIHGMGLFADQFIPEGTATWRFDPGIDRSIHPDRVEQMPEVSREWFVTYAYLDIRTGLYVLCADESLPLGMVQGIPVDGAAYCRRARWLAGKRS